ncbi:C40 family peptidase [Kitasatospora sp. NPDC057198]|uniref:C40 family peptidase n=1 Tax=Kitasatospora sp. NPDC057198 TaxID=3346046 RepID=UPI0036366236
MDVTAVGDLFAWAKAQLGKPYVWGGTGPSGYDCSGFTQGAFKSIGISIPRTSQEQRNAGVGVPLDQIQPGDLVTFTYPNSGSNPGPGNHVALYLGAGQVIEAARTGVPIRIAPMNTTAVDRVRRVLGTSGSSGAAGPAPAASNTTGTVSTAGLQQAGYDAVINVTPWGIPTNPFKLPGWIQGKLGEAGRAVGGSIVDAFAPVALAVLGVALGAGLILIGGYVTVKPAIDDAADKVKTAASVAKGGM